MTDYARKNGFVNIKHYTDDGYTGRNFNRPGFQEMLSDAEAGKIGTIIVKDMSRFGRNYLQVGFYTEMLFPQKEIRFIAINNSVDSDSPTDNDFTPFLNIMNEWYAKDTSNKIKSIFLSRMTDGKRCSGSIPYGYNRLPEDKQKLVVDPVASKVVRRIFELAAEGNNPPKIARLLTEEKTLIPSAYTLQYHPEQCNMKAVPGNCEWNNNTVRDILHRQEYLGHTVLRKTIATNFKTDKRRFSTDDEKLVFENTHEPIVTEDLWNKAHSRLIHRTSRHSHEEIMKGCLLAGYVYCFDCGRKLALESHYYKNGGRYYSYRCPGLYRKRSKCTNHYISENSLSQLILHALQRITARIIEDEEGFSNLLKEGWQKQKAQAPVQNKRELLAAEKRFEELDTLISSLYENFVSGILPERQYVSLMKKYDDEQSELDTKIKRMQEGLAEVKVSTIDARRFIEVIKKYKEPKELTRDMVEELIDKIVVHDSVGKKPNREQQIDIYFNFIGQLELPFSQAELRAEKKKQEKLEAQKKASQKKRNKEYQKRQKAIRYANNEGHKFAKKICAHCGKEFWPQGNMAKYCSKECLKEVNANRIKAKRQAYKGDHPFGQKKCRRCGTPFWPVNGQEVLCSEECKKANRNERQLAYYHEHYSPQKNDSTLKAV